MIVDIRDLIAHAKRIGAAEVTVTIKLQGQDAQPVPLFVPPAEPPPPNEPDDTPEETPEERIERERKSRLVPDGYDPDVMFPK